jgi:hypothetical protein
MTKGCANLRAFIKFKSNPPGGKPASRQLASIRKSLRKATAAALIDNELIAEPSGI